MTRLQGRNPFAVLVKLGNDVLCWAPSMVSVLQLLAPPRLISGGSPPALMASSSTSTGAGTLGYYCAAATTMDQSFSSLSSSPCVRAQGSTSWKSQEKEGPEGEDDNKADDV
ncbi:hypothetical protein OsI_02835 [Oryza sativa Indica Group]|uniref:Uncharacterized protein n=1 Tax=Oryza sativa subsp. indica TaxID=39946 RepID=B8ABZ4_ORYSI|nr:hypothetical protein OsI_02835 [Oryza sativa Indica Group]